MTGEAIGRAEESICRVRQLYFTAGAVRGGDTVLSTSFLGFPVDSFVTRVHGDLNHR